MRKKIFLSSPNMCGEEMKYIQEAFDTNWIAPLGSNVNELEKAFAKYAGTKAAVAMSAGTAAIHMALKAAGVKENDIVFCSSLTFSASANPIKYLHAMPVFIDSEPESWNMSPAALEKAYEKYEPAAVVVVNLYGQSADFDKIKKICIDHGTPIIEDAAESLGATYKGRKTGSIGDYGVFSFNGNKIITTSGGGMLVSDHEENLKRVLKWITQSREPARHYQHEELGYNYRMSNVVAGIGRGQITVLDKRVRQKKDIYERYQKAFREINEIDMMPIADFGEPNYWLSCMTLKKESHVTPLIIMEALEAENIESRPIWKPMHLQPYYRNCEFFPHCGEDIPVSEDIFNRGVCLPSDTNMSEEEQKEVINIIKELF